MSAPPSGGRVSGGGTASGACPPFTASPPATSPVQARQRAVAPWCLSGQSSEREELGQVKAGIGHSGMAGSGWCHDAQAQAPQQYVQGQNLPGRESLRNVARDIAHVSLGKALGRLG